MPEAMARSMRINIEDHFVAPHSHTAAHHHIWNYWFLLELYSYLRTSPKKVIIHGSVEGFVTRLRNIIEFYDNNVKQY
jgi:hypothetical protein